MAPHRILGLNALVTAGCALGMLATRGTLYTLLGFASPFLLDLLAVGFTGTKRVELTCLGRPLVVAGFELSISGGFQLSTAGGGPRER